MTLYSVPPPGSGIILAAIASIIDSINIGTEGAVPYQQIVETFKHVHAHRHEMGDSDFVDMKKLVKKLTSFEYAKHIATLLNSTHTSNRISYYNQNLKSELSPPNDHGTSHFSLLAPNGDAVSVTSTINFYFGAGLVANRTGIVLNDMMEDFCSPNITSHFQIPPTKANYIVPGKRPLSSISSTIILNNTSGDVRLILGGIGWY